MTEQYHFIGIGGIGMSALARVLLQQGKVVSGSDVRRTPIIDQLEEQGASIELEQKVGNIAEEATVVLSSDIPQINPEYVDAVRQGNPILHRSDLLKQLVDSSDALLVAGTHGKTTTSSLLAHLLMHAALDPTIVLGGLLSDSGINGEAGAGRYLVAEADESDGTFLKYHARGAIITNIGNDHMDHYDSEETLIEAFKQFIGQVKSTDLLFWYGEDARLQSIAPKGHTYGWSSACDIRASDVIQEGWMTVGDITVKDRLFSGVKLNLMGEHNFLNALPVFAMGLKLGIDEKVIREAFETFPGVKRRCDRLGTCWDTQFIDDYAHHPTEIATTLKGLRTAIRERRLVAVYQPHRYSRTKHCFDQMESVFVHADKVVITDIYAKGEEPISGITSQALVELISKHHCDCSYIPRSQLVDGLLEQILPHDVVVTMGAGDITNCARELYEKYTSSPPRKLRIGLISGGRSTEHEVSLLSARNVKEALQNPIYDISCFGIDRQGRWKLENEEAATLDSIPSHVMQALSECDVLFPVLHGPLGEDGTIQGFFEILGRPHIGADHRSAATCMDKIQTKRLARQQGVPTLAFLPFTRYDWKYHYQALLKQIDEEFSFPLFVKGNHMGSSIGVTRVDCKEGLVSAIEKTFRVDTKLYIEQGIKAREIEFPVLGNDYIRVFPPGEVLSGGEVYSYAAKYGPQAMATTPNARLDPAVLQEGIQLAEKVYRILGCQGMARLDFFLVDEKQWWLNEANPIPGFTPISLYPKGCEASGIAPNQLMQELVILALQRHRKNHVIYNVNTSEWL